MRKYLLLFVLTCSVGYAVGSTYFRDVVIKNSLSVGVATVAKGTVAISGNTSGTITIQPQAAAGTYNFNLPITVGSAGSVLTSQGGGSTAMTWTVPLSNPMTTTNDMIYSTDNSGTPGRIAGGSGGQYLNYGSPPAWTSFTAHTATIKTSTGSQTGVAFGVSGVTVAPTTGATYTNNGHTYTVVITDASKSYIVASCGTCGTSGTTLTKTGGTGDSTITFSTIVTLATYTPPATAKALLVKVVGGGGGSGGSSSNTGQVSASGGGGGGGYAEKLLTSPASTYYYAVGSAGSGGATGTHDGNIGGISYFVSSANFIQAFYGNGGTGTATTTTVGTQASAASGGSANGGDLNIGGQSGNYGFIFSSSACLGGYGGGSHMGFGGPPTNGGGGNSGQGYGAGGGGSCSIGSGTNSGTSGTAGVVEILEFYNGN